MKFERDEDMRRKAAFAFCVVATVAAGSPAFSAIDPHININEKAEIPANVTLLFGVPVDARRSTAEISGPTGPIQVGSVRQGQNKDELLIPLATNLPAGTYSVKFSTVATNGSPIAGNASITVSLSNSERSAPDLLGAK